MHSFICPSGHHEATIIYVGDSSYRPTHHDLSFIRDKINENRDLLNSIYEWYSGTVTVQIIPASDPDKEYVYLMTCEYEYFKEDIKSYQDIFKDSINDPSWLVFTHNLIDIKRINKVLLPFL
jgi:hypothetical protein